MIERLLAAERALAADQVEVADRMFGQVAAADPRNAIAVVGLARTARRRGDVPAATAHVRRALEIDPEDAAAQQLLGELSVNGTEHPVESEAGAVAAAEALSPAGTTATPSLRPRRGGFIGRLIRVVLGRD
jgi:predicted Zn-dependent protease